MTPAELKTMRESLCLTVEWLAAQADVRGRTIRHWESGRNRVPDDVAQMVTGIESQSRAMVAAALRQVDDARAQLPAGGKLGGVDLRRYASDEELWGRHPEFRPLPVTWHASVLARIARELEARGVEAVIEYAN